MTSSESAALLAAPPKASWGSVFTPTRRPLDHPFGYAVSIAAMVTQVCIFGTGYAFSVFVNSIGNDPALGSPGRSLVALASGVNFGIGPFVGCISGILSDKVGPRPLVVAAAFCHALALVLASYARTPTELVLAYGPLMGCAFGLMVTPGSHATSSYFAKQRSAAMGVNYAGGGAGSALIPHVASLILNHYDDVEWRPSLRWMALLALGCFFPALLLSKRPTDEEVAEQEEKQRRVAAQQGAPSLVVGEAPTTEEQSQQQDANNADASPTSPSDDDSKKTLLELILTRRFASLFCVAVMFGYAFYSSVFFWVPFARAQGHAPYETRTPISLVGATKVTIVFGVVQAVSNILIGIVASAFNPNIAYVASTLLMSAAIFAWPWCDTLWQLLIVAACAGCGAAGARTIFPALTANHFPAKKVGAMMGFTFMGYGVGGLCGPPTTSALVSMRDGKFDVALSVMAIMCTLSAVVYVVAVPKALR